jgi:hypothetical protein
MLVVLSNALSVFSLRRQLGPIHCYLDHCRLGVTVVQFTRTHEKLPGVPATSLRI